MSDRVSALKAKASALDAERLRALEKCSSGLRQIAVGAAELPEAERLAVWAHLYFSGLVPARDLAKLASTSQRRFTAAVAVAPYAPPVPCVGCGVELRPAASLADLRGAHRCEPCAAVEAERIRAAQTAAAAARRRAEVEAFQRAQEAALENAGHCCSVCRNSEGVDAVLRPEYRQYWTQADARSFLVICEGCREALGSRIATESGS